MTPTFSQKSYCMASYARVEMDAVDRVDAVARAAVGADALAAVVVAGGLDFVDLVLAGAEAVETVFAVRVGGRRGDEVALRVAQLDDDAFEQDFGLVEVAVLVLVGVHAAADRGGRLLAEVVLDAVSSEPAIE